MPLPGVLSCFQQRHASLLKKILHIKYIYFFQVTLRSQTPEHGHRDQGMTEYPAQVILATAGSIEMFVFEYFVVKERKQERKKQRGKGK